MTREGNQVLRFDPEAGTVRHLAGTGKAGFTQNPTPALEAVFSGPKGISIATDGSVYLADTENNAILRYQPPDGLIRRVAGTGEKGSAFATDPLKAQLNRPHGVFADADGSLFIADSENHRIFHLRP